MIKLKSVCVISFSLISFVLLLTAIALFAWAANSPPHVSNVRAGQRSGTKLVDIYYDVTDPDGDLLTISVAVSDDGGATFTVPVLTLTGDVGHGITPGGGKHIVWDAGADYPDVYRTNCRVKITAREEEIGPTCPSLDGAPMVLIPAGEFQMGDSFSEGSKDERPVHAVYLDAFCIDVYEVTNARYAAFLNAYGGIYDSAGKRMIDIYANSCLIEEVGNTYRPKEGYGNFPVIDVSWHGAKAYAEFYGKRLPTEAEWEKAARGGLVGARYPWGNSITPSDANYKDTPSGDPITAFYPVDSFKPNGYGLYNVAGNVEEWCADWYYPEDYYSKSPYRNPQGSESGYTRVVRGGSFGEPAADMRVALRNYLNPDWERPDMGFRCVSSPDL